MSVYHCPLCPLIFTYRTEVEWHLREEHRSRVEEELDLRNELGQAAAAADDLSWLRLRALRASLGGTAVTLLLGTSPAPTMTVLDVARLRRLADNARRRLPAEAGPSRTAFIEQRLGRLVAVAEGERSDRGLALLVNERDMALFRLPFAPRERAVVDPAFATRDLEYALRRWPRYRVLVLGSHPRLLEGTGRSLTEVAGPREHPARRSGGAVIGGEAVGAAEALLDWRRDVAGELPLVLVGDGRSIEAFRRRSTQGKQAVAEIHRSWVRRRGLVEAASVALERAYLDHQARALADLRSAASDGRLQWGVGVAREAIESGTADRLWVEHSFSQAGWPDGSDAHREPPAEATEPGATDDLVDVLLARAAEEGVTVEVLDDGLLDHPARLAVRIGGAHHEPDSSRPSLTVA